MEGDPSFVEVRSSDPLSDDILDVESMPVKVGEDTFVSTTIPAEVAPDSLNSSSENAPEDLRPDLQGGLTDNVVAHVLTDLLLALDKSVCRLFKARWSLRAMCGIGLGLDREGDDPIVDVYGLYGVYGLATVD